MEITIRRANEDHDYEDIWTIFSSVVKSGDTYTFSPDTPKNSMHKYWFAEGIDSFVAVDDQGKISGTYFIKPNQVDLGSHIANCGYMVSANARGKGVGQLMCEHSLSFAKEKGYLGIQFNIVVSTNVTAIKLWERCGFQIIGTTPKGFRHQTLGLVDTYIMFKAL